MSIVRVQIIQDNEWRNVAQLDEPLAKVYIENLVSEHFGEQLVINASKTKSPTVQKRINDFYNALQNAIFNDAIRIVPFQEYVPVQ